MDFEIVKENIEYSAPIIECCLCKRTGDKVQWTYAMLKNTFYCNECWKIIPNINSILDKRFNELEKRTDDLIKGAVEKNIRLRKLQERVEDNEKQLEEKVESINNFLGELIKKSKELEEK